jgi:hypothetical protein
MKLTQHLKQDSDKKALLQRFMACRDIVERIIEVLEADKADSERISRNRDRLKNPSWAEETAFELGSQHRAQAIIDMLNQAIKEK